MYSVIIGKPNDIHIRILSFLCSCIIFVFVFGHFWETEYYSYLFNTQLSGTSATVSYCSTCFIVLSDICVPSPSRLFQFLFYVLYYILYCVTFSEVCVPSPLRLCVHISELLLYILSYHYVCFNLYFMFCIIFYIILLYIFWDLCPFSRLLVRLCLPIIKLVVATPAGSCFLTSNPPAAKSPIESSKVFLCWTVTIPAKISKAAFKQHCLVTCI